MAARIGKYRLGPVIGKGATSIVHLCWRRFRTTPYACKVLDINPGTAHGETQAFRFARERSLSIAHPALIQPIDIVETPQVSAIILPFATHGSLRRVLDVGPRLSSAAVASIGIELAGALSALHSRGVVHRDLKPDNILLFHADSSAVRARLADFGHSRAETSAPLTTIGGVVGTVGYIPPEVVRGEPATPASDVWSLGQVLSNLADR